MISIIGATGTTGKYLVQELAGKGLEFRCIIRDADRAREALGEDIDFVT